MSESPPTDRRAGIIAGSLDTIRSNLTFNWMLPVMLVLWGIKRSSAVATEAPSTLGRA
jgi:hypothetical protein